MLNDPGYDNREVFDALKRIEKLRKAPLAHRREARAAFLESLRDPDLIAERVHWILIGNYGYGEMLIARQILSNKRMNRAAALVHMVAALDDGCPEDFARAAWHELSAREQTKLDRAVKATIARVERELADADA